MLDWTNPATAALNEIRTAPLVRFSVLALSSIFFLVDPFAAIPSFLAITQSVDEERRKRMARKAALTCFIVLTSFALAGAIGALAGFAGGEMLLAFFANAPMLTFYGFVPVALGGMGNNRGAVIAGLLLGLFQQSANFLVGGIFGLCVAPFVKYVLRFFPAVVTGTIITMIGVVLMRVGVNWAGFYAGVNGGYGWGAQSKVLDLEETVPGGQIIAETSSRFSPEGAFGGGQIGYNWQPLSGGGYKD